MERFESQVPEAMGIVRGQIQKALNDFQGTVVLHVEPRYRYPGQGGVELKEGELHICFETNPDAHDLFVTSSKGIKALKEKKVLALNHPFLEVPLKPGTVDKIHIDNVFTDPSVKPDEIKRILQKAAKLLKPDGAIYFGHTNEPHRFTKKHLQALIRRRKLQMEILVEDWEPDVLERRVEESLGKSERHSPELPWNRPTDDEWAILSQHMGPSLRTTGSFHDGYFLAKMTKKSGKPLSV